MESLGLSEGLTGGVSAAENVLAQNRNIREQNRMLQRNFQKDVGDLKAKEDTFKTAETEDVGQSVASQIASKGKSLELGAKSAYEVGRRVPAVANEAMNIFENFESPADSVMRKLQVDSRSLLPESSLTEDIGKTLRGGAAVGETIAERAGSVGKLGLGATGLGVAIGAKDLVDDFVQGKVEGKNTAEKFSNIANIASGALEGLGTALDLTGVGAGVGVGLQALGGLVGLAGGVADVAGEEEEKKSTQQQVQTLQQRGAPQIQQGAIRVGEGGVVRPN